MEGLRFGRRWRRLGAISILAHESLQEYPWRCSGRRGHVAFLVFIAHSAPAAAELVVSPLQEHVMRPLRYSINVTLDGCCDHRAGFTDEELHRYWAESLARADALLLGRVTYEMME